MHVCKFIYEKLKCNIHSPLCLLSIFKSVLLTAKKLNYITDQPYASHGVETTNIRDQHKAI